MCLSDLVTWGFRGSVFTYSKTRSNEEVQHNSPNVLVKFSSAVSACEGTRRDYSCRHHWRGDRDSVDCSSCREGSVVPYPSDTGLPRSTGFSSKNVN